VKVLVYVEGPSDRVSLETLLSPIIEQASSNGVGIRFLPLGSKSAVLDDCPRKAADHLLDNSDDWVFALPDLYPMAPYEGTGNAHNSFETLRTLLRDRFSRRADTIHLSAERRLAFRVHCLKHDLEALVLASTDQLKRRLRTSDALTDAWRKPVEDQNDFKPPKRIVEALFNKYRKKPKYQDTVDAPWILQLADLGQVKARCSQRFAPFVGELESLAQGEIPE
jgi:hypothetical protein